ncbi:MAG: hypothetical protein QG602_808 [Verrucomicrobiota bacterium]|nr:hypothetical protein [Verrucomicrobiota bacterium]
MKAPRRWFLVLAAGVLVNLGLAAEVSPVAAARDGSFRITAKATHKFTRNTDKLKDQAMAAATEFCSKEGKMLKVLNVEEDRPQYLVGRFPSVTLTFKALAATEAELAPVATAAQATPKPMTTDELATELTRLDELRKKGLLNDAEFEALKQKLLSRF